MSSDRWLVNDCLGTIGGIRTLWHNLRDFCGCRDMTGQLFKRLADCIEQDAAACHPKIIIRNATYFRPLSLPAGCRTISIAQDIVDGDTREIQRQVIERSDVVVFNSEYARDAIGCPAGVRGEVIPIGTDFDLFKPFGGKSLGSVLFVGSGHEVKGWRLLNEIVDQADGIRFAVVTKDGARIDHPRANSCGPVAQQQLAMIMRTCSLLLCTSAQETQHLAGVEAAACGLPLVVPPVGIYPQLRDHQPKWGEVVDSREPEAFIAAIRRVQANCASYRPRDFMLSQGLDRATCMARWLKLIEEIEGLPG